MDVFRILLFKYEVFDLRLGYYTFIRVLVVTMILRPGKFPGKGSVKNNITSAFPTLCKFKISACVGKVLL